MLNGDSALLLGFVGDVYIHRDTPSSAFQHVDSVLRQFDYRFANLESIFTDQPEFAPSAGIPAYVPTDNADGMRGGPFQVVSLAHNHTLDAGHTAMLETKRILRDANILTCGAGADINEARKPAVLTASGRSIATLAYASVFPSGYEARQNWPGIAPARSINIYEGTANHWIPGEIPTVCTVPYEPDFSAVASDIAEAKREHDVVVASFHWGDWTRKFHVTDHERRLARFAIDAGADVVVGHHHHALRAIEFYKGRPIFYGLGHFVFDAVGGAQRASELDIWAGDADSYGTLAVRPGMPDTFPFHPDMRMTAIAWCRIDEHGGVEAGYIPCLINESGDPIVVNPQESDGVRVMKYAREANLAAQTNIDFDLSSGIRIDGIGMPRAYKVELPKVVTK